MPEHLNSQGSALVLGVNAFEPFVNRLHGDFRNAKFSDWPTVILATTFQSTAVSIFKLLPAKSDSSGILDKRSLATLVRNIVDTHDVLEMMVNAPSAEEFELNRCILGLYLSSRIDKVRKSVDESNCGDFYTHTKSWYWKRIQASPLYSKSMLQLKNGEQLHYRSRKERAEAACGEDTKFVLGILADLSTFVHSVPPPLWMGPLENLYSNTQENRDVVAVWLRLANFYLARCMEVVLKATQYSPSQQLEEFLKFHETVFN